MSVNLKQLKAKRDRVNELRKLAEKASDEHNAIVASLNTSSENMILARNVFNEEFQELEEMGRKFAVDDGESDYTPEMKFAPTALPQGVTVVFDEISGLVQEVKVTPEGVQYTSDAKGNPMMLNSNCTCGGGKGTWGDPECPQHSESVAIAIEKAKLKLTKIPKAKKYKFVDSPDDVPFDIKWDYKHN